MDGSPRTRNMQRIVLEYRIVPQSEDNIEDYLPSCNVRQKLRQKGHDYLFILNGASNLAMDFNKNFRFSYIYNFNFRGNIGAAQISNRVFRNKFFKIYVRYNLQRD